MAKVSVKGLEKSFGDLHVLRGIDLDVEQGEVVCLIGLPVQVKVRFSVA